MRRQEGPNETEIIAVLRRLNEESEEIFPSFFGDVSHCGVRDANEPSRPLTDNVAPANLGEPLPVLFAAEPRIERTLTACVPT
jgi:hypothetical protein